MWKCTTKLVQVSRVFEWLSLLCPLCFPGRDPAWAEATGHSLSHLHIGATPAVAFFCPFARPTTGTVSFSETCGLIFTLLLARKVSCPYTLRFWSKLRLCDGYVPANLTPFTGRCLKEDLSLFRYREGRTHCQNLEWTLIFLKSRIFLEKTARPQCSLQHRPAFLLRERWLPDVQKFATDSQSFVHVSDSSLMF